MAKLTLLKMTTGYDGCFHSNWGTVYEKDVPQEIPMKFAIAMMGADNCKVEFESSDLDGLHESTLEDLSNNLGLESGASLNSVKKMVLPQKSKSKKVVESVAALIPKKEVEEAPVEEAPVEESSSDE